MQCAAKKTTYITFFCSEFSSIVHYILFSVTQDMFVDPVE